MKLMMFSAGGAPDHDLGERQVDALRRLFPKVADPETMGMGRREYTKFLTILAEAIERDTPPPDIRPTPTARI